MFTDCLFPIAIVIFTYKQDDWELILQTQFEKADIDQKVALGKNAGRMARLIFLP